MIFRNRWSDANSWPWSTPHSHILPEAAGRSAQCWWHPLYDKHGGARTWNWSSVQRSWGKQLPSGVIKHGKILCKWSLKMGKSSVNGGYSIAMLDCQYQRVSATYSVDGCSTECSFPTRRSFASVHLHTAVTRPPFTLRESFSPPLSIYLLAHHMHLNKIIKSTQWCPMLRTAAPTQLAKASCICSGSEVPCLRWCHLNTWRSFRLSFAIGNVQAIHLGIWPTMWSWFIGPTHGHWSLSGMMTPLCPHACDDHIHTHLLDGPGWDIYTKDIVCKKNMYISIFVCI